MRPILVGHIEENGEPRIRILSSAIGGRAALTVAEARDLRDKLDAAIRIESGEGGR